nr:phosphotransferase [Pseudonocardia abyssalis]
MLPIDESLARRLVAAQFPRWADLPVVAVPRQGVDNRTFRLGESLSVRLPSAAGYVAAVEKELRWLPRLAPGLPLPIPSPSRRARRRSTTPGRGRCAAGSTAPP